MLTCITVVGLLLVIVGCIAGMGWVLSQGIMFYVFFGAEMMQSLGTIIGYAVTAIIEAMGSNS